MRPRVLLFLCLPPLAATLYPLARGNLGRPEQQQLTEPWPLTALDPKSLQVLAARSVDPRLLVAMAFQDIAANAAKVGNLNISPDLLQTLLENNGHS